MAVLGCLVLWFATAWLSVITFAGLLWDSSMGHRLHQYLWFAPILGLAYWLCWYTFPFQIAIK